MAALRHQAEAAGRLDRARHFVDRKAARARRLVEAAGCALRFLPRYSPDLNPIEPAFAKLKGALRRAEARSFDALVAAAKPAIEAVSPADAHGFFAAAGYPLSEELP